MKKPKFSVLMACFNAEKYIKTAIMSVLSQEWENWELIILDDGSLDNSFAIAQKFRNSKIKIFKNERNMGCGYTKRKLIKLSNGEIAGFLDADDALTPNALKVMVNQHIKNPSASLVYSNHILCDENLIPDKIAPYVGKIPINESHLTRKGPKISHFVTFKRDFYLNTSGINPFFRIAEDQDLYYKLEETGSIIYIDKTLYHYRKNDKGTSQNQNAAYGHMLNMQVSILAYKRRKKNKFLPNLEAYEIKSRRRMVFNWYFRKIKKHRNPFIFFDYLSLIILSHKHVLVHRFLKK